MEDQKRLLGVTICFWYLLLTNIIELAILTDFDLYKFMFRYLPQSYIVARYIGSIAIRLLLIISSFGLRYYKDIFRKAIIIIGIYTIITVYWKHPLEAFINLDQYFNVDVQALNRILFYLTDNKSLDYDLYKRFSVLASCAHDVISYTIIVFYLTRRKVREKFV